MQGTKVSISGTKRLRRVLLIAMGAATLIGPALAQFKDGSQPLAAELPRLSQHAKLTQRVGITDITIDYSRPLMNGRDIWGKEVPFGKVWRAGANENTTIEFSDPVSVEGQPVAAGKYGLHMIPNKDEWTIILSKANASWGSFTYKEDEDALRVKVKPVPAERSYEALTYDVDLPAPDAATLSLKWGKVEVPVQIKVDVAKTVTASVERQMRGSASFNPAAQLELAKYFYETKLDEKKALAFATPVALVEPTFPHLMLKSEIEKSLGKTAEAAESRKQAFELAQPLQLYNFARGLQREKKQEEAFDIFRTFSKRFPDSWVTRLANVRLRVADKQFDQAKSEMKLAVAGAPDQVKPQLESLMKRLEENQDINQ